MIYHFNIFWILTSILLLLLVGFVTVVVLINIYMMKIYKEARKKENDIYE
jgi:uncharacterized protein YdaL